MNYLVIDLEMCRVKKLYRKTYKYASEIIQIGAVLLDEGFNRIATMCEYVNPEYGVLDNFIESMTGIKNRDIKQAPKLTEALEHLTDWLGVIDLYGMNNKYGPYLIATVDAELDTKSDSWDSEMVVFTQTDNTIKVPFTLPIQV